MEFANIVNCFKYLFTSSHFRTGQSSSFEVYAISLSLSLSNISQSNMRWSVDWSPWVQAHSGDWIILKRCRYALVFPCAVTIAVKLGDSLSYIISRALISGKFSLVTSPLAVAEQKYTPHFGDIYLNWFLESRLFFPALDLRNQSKNSRVPMTKGTCRDFLRNFFLFL